MHGLVQLESNQIPSHYYYGSKSEMHHEAQMESYIFSPSVVFLNISTSNDSVHNLHPYY